MGQIHAVLIHVPPLACREITQIMLYSRGYDNAAQNIREYFYRNTNAVMLYYPTLEACERCRGGAIYHSSIAQKVFY